MKKKIPSNANKHTCALGGQQRAVSQQELPAVIERLRWEVRRSIFQGCDTFISGMTKGISLIAAEQILLLRQEYPHINLHCYLPCETQASHWPESWRERYFRVLGQANEVVCMQTRYTPGCLQKGVREVLRRSSRLLAVYQESNASPYFLRYARAIGLEVVPIIPSRLAENSTRRQAVAK